MLELLHRSQPLHAHRGLKDNWLVSLRAIIFNRNNSSIVAYYYRFCKFKCCLAFLRLRCHKSWKKKSETTMVTISLVDWSPTITPKMTKLRCTQSTVPRKLHQSLGFLPSLYKFIDSIKKYYEQLHHEVTLWGVEVTRGHCKHCSQIVATKSTFSNEKHVE